VKRNKVPQSAQIAIVVAVLLIVVLAGYFLLIGPQRKKAASLTKQIASTEQQIYDARAAELKFKNTPKVRIADLFRLTKAMPDQPDEPGIILELNEIARATGISFDAISPQAAQIVSGYQAIPINLIFQGNFYNLSDFFFRLRKLVDVQRGELEAAGRLFAIDKIQFDAGDKLFPQIKATLTVDAFVFGASPGSVSAAEPAAASTPSTTTPAGGTTATPTTSASTTTTSTTTTPTTTTSPPPSSGAAAAGATP
jgi:cell division septation protein DedD